MSTPEPVEAMRRKILKDAQEEAQRIISEAERRALEIVEQVKADTVRRGEEEREEARERIERNKRERIAEERAEHLRRIQSYKSEILDNVFDEALRRLRKYCETDTYLDTLKRFVVEAGVALGGGDLIVSLNEKDKGLADEEFFKDVIEDIEGRTDKKTNVKLADEPVKSIGGAIVSKADGSATVNNTIEERMNRLKGQIGSELETILFR